MEGDQRRNKVIDSSLRNIIFSTRLGGTHNGDNTNGSSTEVTGTTSDTDFPVTPGAFQTKPPHWNR